jgi:hypothetical protein
VVGAPSRRFLARAHTLEAALGRAARLRVVSAEHFPSPGVNEVHLRTDRAIHRHKLARVRGLVFLRDETLHPVSGGGALEQKTWHMGAIINSPETSTPDKHLSFGSVAVAALSPAMDYGRLRGRLAPQSSACRRHSPVWFMMSAAAATLDTIRKFIFSFVFRVATRLRFDLEGEIMAKRNGIRRAWTSEHVRTLKSLARKRTPAGKIARSLKRTEGATRQKAFALGLSLDSRI